MSKAFKKIESFVEAVAHKVHKLDTDQLRVALTNIDPAASADKLADLTGSIDHSNSAGDLDGDNPFNVTTTSSEETGGEYKLVVEDLTLTAVATVGPFKYIVLYNDAAGNKEIIGYYDYEASITLHSGDTFKIDWSQTDGVLTIE